MKLNSEAIKHFLEPYSGAHCWIAYSGGLDSTVLLSLCSDLKDFKKFTAIHVHHGLQDSADDWALHCEKTCLDLNMAFKLIKVDAAAKPGESLEEIARLSRYQAIIEQMSENDLVLTAQHRDDQAETILLQLMRGSGLSGLCAMPERAPLGPGLLLRPLLNHSRDDLYRFALSRHLNWVEDPSNAALNYDRNFLRQAVIPQLETHWPGVKKALARSAAHCAEAKHMLDDLACDLYQAVKCPGSEEESETLSVSKLKALKYQDQKLVLREWLKDKSYRMPSAKMLERVLTEVLPAAIDKMPLVSWPEGEIRRYRDRLYLLQPLKMPKHSEPQLWKDSKKLKLEDGNGELYVSFKSDAACKAWFEKKIEVRYRQGGENLKLRGRCGSHDLKKLFQDSGIPPWIRERTPLIYIDDELAAVADYWVCMNHQDIEITWLNATCRS